MLREMLGDWFPQVGTTLARMRARQGRLVRRKARAWRGRGLVLAFWQIENGRFYADSLHSARGRPPGTYDKFYRTAVAGRRVFLKHAIPERRIFKSAGDFSRGYNSRMWQFFTYSTPPNNALRAANVGRRSTLCSRLPICFSRSRFAYRKKRFSHETRLGWHPYER